MVQTQILSESWQSTPSGNSCLLTTRGSRLVAYPICGTPSIQVHSLICAWRKKIKEGMKKNERNASPRLGYNGYRFFFSLAATAIAHCWLSFAHPFGRCQYAKVLQTRIY